MRHRAMSRGSEAAERVRRLVAGAAETSPKAAASWADGGRWRMAATAVAALAAALLAGGWVLASQPRADPGSPVSTAAVNSAVVPSAARSTRVSPGPSSDAPLVVDVAGKVRHPGLYRLASGARVDDAVRAAGGALPGVDLTTLNRAAPVADGEQVLVGVAAPVPPAGPSKASSSLPGASGVGAGRVSLNIATVEQLQALPGVGPVLAQHIADWRTQHGRFTTIEQLQDVSGIGPAKFAGLKDRVTL